MTKNKTSQTEKLTSEVKKKSKPGIPFQCRKCKAIWDGSKGGYPCPVCKYDGKTHLS